MVKTNKVVQEAVKRSRRASSMREMEPGEVLEKIQNPEGNSNKETYKLESDSYENACEPEMEASAEPSVTVFVTVGNGPGKATGVIQGFPDASR